MRTVFPPERGDIIDRFVEAIDDDIVTLSGQVGQCIEWASIGVRTLRRYGVHSKALPCALLAANKSAVPLIDDGVPVADWPIDAWSIGCAPGQEGPHPRAVDYHVLIVGTEPSSDGSARFVIDLTARQFSRPAKALEIGGAIVVRDVTVDPFDVPGDLSVMVGSARVTYTPMPWIKSFRNSGAWRADNKAAMRELTDRLDGP